MVVVQTLFSGGGFMNSGKPNPYSQEELQSVLWEILEECANGRTEGHTCPFCGQAKMGANVEDEAAVRLECASCGKYFEGQLV
jgi:hypothetical protein